MHVFLTGATGFIGGHTLRALLARGHILTCLIRPRASSGDSSRAVCSHPNIHVVVGEWTQPDTWLDHLAGHEAIVSTIGIIRERPGATFEAVQARAPIALFERATRVGVQKIVQISALGADEGATTSFLRTKRPADRALAQLGLPYLVLRPSFVYGPGSQSMSFFIRLAALPVTPVAGDGRYLVQPLHIDDLVRAIVESVERPGLCGIVDVGGGTTLSFDALLDALARASGKPKGAHKLHIPWTLMRVIAALTDLLGGRGPITSDELTMLRQGSFTNNDRFIELFGFEPQPFAMSPTQV